MLQRICLRRRAGGSLVPVHSALQQPVTLGPKWRASAAGPARSRPAASRFLFFSICFIIKSCCKDSRILRLQRPQMLVRRQLINKRLKPGGGAEPRSRRSGSDPVLIEWIHLQDFLSVSFFSDRSRVNLFHTGLLLLRQKTGAELLVFSTNNSSYKI